MYCKQCKTKLIQIGGWFLGEAKFECPKCDSVKVLKESISNDRYIRIPPTGGVSNGVIKDCKTGVHWTEKNFIGNYTSLQTMIHQLNGVKYNDCDTWHLPTISELLDIVEVGRIPTTTFPGIKVGIYFSKQLSTSNSVPVVDFSAGNTYNVNTKTAGNFKLIK